MIAVLGHSWGSASYEWAPDNSSVTATRKCTRDNTHTESETARTTSQIISEPTSTTPGSRKFTATFNNAAFSTQTKTVEIPATGGGSSASVVYTFSSESCRPGEELLVTLSIESEITINTIGLRDLEYDDSVLEFIGFVDRSEIVKNSIAEGVLNDSMGTIGVMMNSAGTPCGKLCSLKFKVKEGATDCQFNVSMSATTKYNSTVVQSLVVPGLITVRNYIPGDLTGDDNVDISDVIMLLQYSIFPDLYPLDYPGTVDFTNDGNVDISDVITLLQYSIFPDLYPLQ